MARLRTNRERFESRKSRSVSSRRLVHTRLVIRNSRARLCVRGQRLERHKLYHDPAVVRDQDDL